MIYAQGSVDESCGLLVERHMQRGLRCRRIYTAHTYANHFPGSRSIFRYYMGRMRVFAHLIFHPLGDEALSSLEK
jgi:hypothetical protein